MAEHRDQLLTSFLLALVDHPDELHVNVLRHSAGVIYDVKAADADLGRILGKKGATVNSMRSLMASVCGKFGESVRIIVQTDSTVAQ